MNELALFAGHGGGILGSKLLPGWRIVGAVEIDDYARRVLMARQDDGCLEPFPIWDDIVTFDGKPWRGLVDRVSGGFPCVGISPERDNKRFGKPIGLADPKSGLWEHQLRIIGEVEPWSVGVENHANLTKRGLETILGALASLGFDAEWGVISAQQAGAPHKRERLWIEATHPHRTQRKREQLSGGKEAKVSSIGSCVWWKTEPGIRRVDDGMANRVDRLKGTGNGQVPAVVRLAWETLKP